MHPLALRSEGGLQSWPGGAHTHLCSPDPASALVLNIPHSLYYLPDTWLAVSGDGISPVHPHPGWPSPRSAVLACLLMAYIYVFSVHTPLLYVKLAEKIDP